MRKIYFLFPQMNLDSGGHLAQLRLCENIKSICPAESITYESHEVGTRFLDAILEQDDINDAIFFIHWGPHVSELIHRLSGKNIVYVSYSTGYGFRLPPNIPIIAGSRHTQAYWGRYAPNSLIFYLPCEIAEKFKNLHLSRDIDVLVQTRKSSRYLIEALVPGLRSHCSVMVLDSWVDDLAEIFNRSKLYLYDSTEYWHQHGVSEGFGLPPLEALACGCTVFSSLNDALSDYLDPGINCHKLRVYSEQYDSTRILRAIKKWKDDNLGTDPAIKYRKKSILKRLSSILIQINEFFDQAQQDQNTIEDIDAMPCEVEIQLIKERLQKIEHSRGWKLLEGLRSIHAGFSRR